MVFKFYFTTLCCLFKPRILKLENVILFKKLTVMFINNMLFYGKHLIVFIKPV